MSFPFAIIAGILTVMVFHALMISMARDFWKWRDFVGSLCTVAMIVVMDCWLIWVVTR